MSSSSTTGTGTGLRRRRWRSRAVRRGVSMSVLFAVGLGTAFGAKPARQLVWRTEASRWVARLDPADSSRTVAAAPRFELGDLSSNQDLVYSESAPQAAASVLRWVRPARRETARVEVGAGRTPRLLRLRRGGFISITFGVDATGRTLPFASGSREIESAWKSPVAISARAGVPSLGSGRLVETRDGVVLVPIAWHIPDSPAAAQIVIHTSRDGGATWEEIGSIEAVQDAALAPLQDGQIVAICRQGADLSRCTSTDGGRSWSALQPLDIASRPGPFALVNDASSTALGLAWTDIDPDTTVALPALQELRFALSKNAGATWQRTRALALHPGRVPVEPALELAKDKLTAAYVERPAIPGEPGERIVCMEYSRDWLVSNRNPIERRESRYGIDPVAAREALRIYCAHTINRPAAARALFVDGYHMRTLAAAHAVFDSLPAENPEWFDPKAGLETALRWADALVQKQDSIGYFPIGYGAVFLADMAASLGVFPALEPYAGEARLREYEATVRRFTTAMQQDRMIAPSGAVGIGWPGSFYPRAPKRARRDAYLVSTALAGIELHAWLYHRSGAAADRDAALRSLDYTLSQLQPDGAFPRSPMIQSKTESHITAAAYVEEGWIAADVYLKDPAVLAKLKAALPPHITWLLQTQRADGGWGGEEDGEFARTPAIVDFLIWYDQRCESRPEVRDAIRRAGLRFVDPAQLEAIGFYQSKPYLAVQRAITGRALVAMSRERFVP